MNNSIARTTTARLSNAYSFIGRIERAVSVCVCERECVCTVLTKSSVHSVTQEINHAEKLCICLQLMYAIIESSAISNWYEERAFETNH